MTPARSARSAVSPIGLLVLAGFVLLGLWCAAGASAQTPEPTPAEVALAERYAPTVKLQDRPGDGECREGEPYEPIDVTVLMDNDEVLLRGPWDRTNVVEVAPSAQRLAPGLWGYHLDFPGDPLRPGCEYAEWAERITEGSPPTMYARVNAEEGKPGLLSLQYWFFYIFNDWNNTHEGDWEMIQLNFPADTAEEALETEPLEVGYSQHSSGERAVWGDPKLELEGGTHPVVYPAAGSHANFFSQQVFLMRSEAEGVGCDDAGGSTRTVRPALVTVPSAQADHVASHPWLGYFGRWGEKQTSVFNGPTGPNEKLSWTHPITWSQEYWREDSFSVPSGGLIGTQATDFFCTAVGSGSELLRRAKANPVPVLVLLAVLAALIAWGFSRTRWRPSVPVDLRRRRAWGEMLTTSLLMVRSRPRVFLGIGVLFLPLGALITLVQYLVFNVTALDALLEEAGEQNSFVASLAMVLGLFFAVLGLAAVHAATARAAVCVARGEKVTALSAFRAVLSRWRELAWALAIAFVVQVFLNVTLILIPVAIFFLVRWSLYAIAIGVEENPSPSPLRRSAALTRGNWWRTAAVLGGVTGVALLIGPAIGVLALIATGAAFTVINLISALVYMVAMPVAALTMVYLYFDLVERQEEEAAEAESTDPAGRPAPPTGAPAEST